MVFTEFHFEYAGTSSRAYNLIVANLNTSEFTQSSGTVSSRSFFNKKNRRKYWLDDDYSDSPISMEIDILTEDATPIDLGQLRAIERWLFQKHDYAKFYVDVKDDYYGETQENYDDGVHRTYLMCRFLNPTKITDITGRIVGWTVTMECDSWLLYQDAVSYIFDLAEAPAEQGRHNLVLSVDSAGGTYVYPTVSIVVGETGGNISIANATDDASRITGFTNLSANTHLTMNSETNMMTSGYYSRFVGANFLRLLDGTNRLVVSGDVKEVTITFNNRRML